MDVWPGGSFAACQCAGTGDGGLGHNRPMPDFGNARHLPAHEYTRERWHNGAGWTRRILRLPGEPWPLGLSVAEIDEPAPYSLLPGVEREQVLLSGDGLRLEFADGEVAGLLPPHQRIRFDGGREVRGIPLDGPPVRAFNVMWRPSALEVTVLHRPLVGGMFCFCDADTAWAMYLLGGTARVASAGIDFQLDGGDSAWLASAARQHFVVDGAGEALMIRVRRAAGAEGKGLDASGLATEL